MPVVAIGILVLASISILVPSLLKSNVIDNAMLEATRTVQQFKTIRGYYTQNIIKPVLKSQKTIKPS
ncbi:MAG: hypothetical protein GY792_35945, partial [Gammaproteobacteria bacterium]|nr:hypothetical protein [Gammaproteobacteria bacterium]